ncbi:MAG: hypothetical protein V7607_1211 [Solirubrobacteraceae bacterium]
MTNAERKELLRMVRAARDTYRVSQWGEMEWIEIPVSAVRDLLRACFEIRGNGHGDPDDMAIADAYGIAHAYVDWARFELRIAERDLPTKRKVVERDDIEDAIAVVLAHNASQRNPFEFARQRAEEART